MAPGNAIAVVAAATAATTSSQESSQEIKGQVIKHAPIDIRDQAGKDVEMSEEERAVSVPSFDGSKDPLTLDVKDTNMADQGAPSVPSDLDSKESSPGLPTLENVKDVEMKEDETTAPTQSDATVIDEDVEMTQKTDGGVDEVAAAIQHDDRKDEEAPGEQHAGDAAPGAAAAADPAAGADEAAGDAAAVVAAPAAEDEPQCLICYDVLAAKRSVMCVPCMHAMHRTCALAWLETRTDERAQFCASCRSSVEMIADMETGEELQAVVAYGSAGQPTRALIDTVYQRGNNEWLTSHLAGEMERTMRTISQLEEARRLATIAGKPKEYVDDIDEESLKLLRRYAILEELDADWAAIRRAQYEAEREAAAEAARVRAARAAAAAAQAAAQAAADAAAAAAAREAAAVQDALNTALEAVAPTAAEAAAPAASNESLATAVEKEADPMVEEAAIAEQPIATIATAVVGASSQDDELLEPKEAIAEQPVAAIAEAVAAAAATQDELVEQKEAIVDQPVAVIAAAVAGEEQEQVVMVDFDLD